MIEEKKIYYKGLDVNFQCRGFQFEIGKTYVHDGDVRACSSGFHSCANPWDVLSYYDVTSRFSKVEVGGKTATHSEDSKIASAEITFKAELKLPEFITDCINYLKDACKSDVDPASGNHSKLAASGDYSKLAASGNYSQLAASGYYSQLAASGYYSQLAASGDYSQLAASGNHSQLAASGNHSKLAASGNHSKLAASGNHSKLAASGNHSKLAASGDYSIAVCAGINGRVKGGLNCALALTRWVESEKRYRITTAYVGEDGIKDDTWYELNDCGEFTEVKDASPIR